MYALGVLPGNLQRCLAAKADADDDRSLPAAPVSEDAHRSLNRRTHGPRAAISAHCKVSVTLGVKRKAIVLIAQLLALRPKGEFCSGGCVEKDDGGVPRVSTGDHAVLVVHGDRRSQVRLVPTQLTILVLEYC